MAAKTEKDLWRKYDEFVKTKSVLEEISTIREKLSENNEDSLKQHVLELERTFNKDEQKYMEYKQKIKTSKYMHIYLIIYIYIDIYIPLFGVLRLGHCYICWPCGCCLHGRPK